MSSHRFLFYVPALGPENDRVTIDGDEHHHLTRVLRMKVGETVFVTNGDGLMVAGEIEDIGVDGSVCSVTRTVSREQPRRRVTLAIALITKPKFEQALEQCVELGITECVPFVSSNSRVGTYGAGFLERLDRIALAAMKQSFRDTRPMVSTPIAFTEMIDRCRAAVNVIVGDADATSLSSSLPGPLAEGEIIVVVGPEAGLSDRELKALADLGATSVSTSAYRLRSETAAVTLVAAVSGTD